jgi:phytoene desaturase
VSKVVVIGGGLGGLAAAARLARLRHDVTLVERADAVGGKIGRLTRDGFTFDTGPSVVTLPATLRDLFLKTGRPLEDALELRPLSPLAHYRFADGVELDLPNTGVNDVADAFAATLGHRAGDEWRRFHAKAERLWDVVRGPFIEAPLGGPASLAALALRRPLDVKVVAPWRSLRDVARAAFHDPRQQMLLERYATYAGSDPRRAPGVLAVIPYVEHTFRGWHVVGGLRTIVTAVQQRALDRGVVVRTGVEAVAVTRTGPRVDGVRLADGETLPADVVVSDVDARHLYAELLPDGGMQRRLGRMTPSLSGFVLLLGLRGTTPDLRQQTVLFGADYDTEFDSVFGAQARPVDDPTIYVSAPRDSGSAPVGHESWFVLVNAPRQGQGPGSIDWELPGVGSSYAELLLDRLAQRGLDVRDRIVLREHRTPADLDRETNSPGGAIYGSSSNGWRAAVLRPANRSPVPGLFLVGGSAHPGGGIPLVLMSAAIVAEMIGRA